MKHAGWQGWVIPRTNGQVRLRKPPLAYWLTAASFKLHGVGLVQGIGNRAPVVRQFARGAASDSLRSALFEDELPPPQWWLAYVLPTSTDFTSVHADNAVL